MPPSPATRAVAVVCLGGVAVTHLIDLPDKLDEAHYMAALFILLIAASLALLAVVVAGRRVDLALVAAGVLSAMTIAGYVLSRSVGLPQIEDHVGMWLDPDGIASLAFEATLVVLAAQVAPLPTAGVQARSGTRAAAR
jgi:hypothetical protein